MTATLPKEMASAAHLMAHPMGAAAALSAVGFGMAGQAAGLWLGTVSAMAGAAQRAWMPASDQAGADAAALRDPSLAPAMRAASVADTIANAGQNVVTAALDAMSPTDAVASPPPASEAPVAPEPAEALSAMQPLAAVVEVAADQAQVAAAVVQDAVAAHQEGAAIAVDAAGTVVEAQAAMLKPAGTERPETPDDLKAIAGIGPKLEQVLNGYGIWTFGQIAGWTSAEVAWMDDMLGFKGRIGRDDWLGQAKRFVEA